MVYPLLLFVGDLQFGEESVLDGSDLLRVVLGQVLQVRHEHVPQVLDVHPHNLGMRHVPIVLVLVELLVECLENAAFLGFRLGRLLLVPEGLIPFILVHLLLHLYHLLHLLFLQVHHLIDVFLGETMVLFEVHFDLGDDHLESVPLQVLLHKEGPRLVLVHFDSL